MNATPVLEGHGVRLLPASLDHVPALSAAQDPDCWTWMSESGATPDQMHGFVKRALQATAAGTTQAWTVTVPLADGTYAVGGSSRLADVDMHHRRAEIGWTWFALPYRGAGLNPRVKLLQLQHAFETLGLRRVALKTHHENLRSQAAMLKLGAQYEGTFRNHMVLPNGGSRDSKWYSILDREWPAVKAGLLQRVAVQPLPTPTDR